MIRTHTTYLYVSERRFKQIRVSNVSAGFRCAAFRSLGRAIHDKPIEKTRHRGRVKNYKSAFINVIGRLKRKSARSDDRITTIGQRQQRHCRGAVILEPRIRQTGGTIIIGPAAMLSKFHSSRVYTAPCDVADM